MGKSGESSLDDRRLFLPGLHATCDIHLCPCHEMSLHRSLTMPNLLVTSSAVSWCTQSGTQAAEVERLSLSMAFATHR